MSVPQKKAWMRRWREGFKASLLLSALIDYYRVGNFTPDITESFLNEIRSLTPENAWESVSQHIDEFRKAHERGDNQKAVEILIRITALLQQF